MFKFFTNILIKIIKLSISLIESYEYRNMSLDENDISKKILNSIELSNIKTKTDTGYQIVSNLHLTQPYKHYILKTKDYTLSCADNHIVFDSNTNEVFVKDLKSGDFINTENGIQKVISVKMDRFKSSMFDATIDHPNHRFYTNGILSHNTISSSIFMLHTILFNNDKNIMIVANKGDTAVEIVDKIKSIYTLLPFFLKPGIKIWNQKSLTFENGCRIKTSARTKTPAIGFTIDLLYLDEFAHIPSNIIEPYYTAVFPTVSAVQNSKIIITSTPNGMNLFHKILTDSEREVGDPLKNNFNSKRVYWYQVPGRFVSYIRLNDHQLFQNNTTKEEIYNQVFKQFSPLTKVEMKWNVDLQKNVIYVYNNEKCSDLDVKKSSIKNSDNKDLSILSVSEVTTWKDEAIKDIGGEDAFNQEYDLRFINGSRSLLNEAIIDDLIKNKRSYEHISIDNFNLKLKFSYTDLKWVIDEDIFSHIKRKEYKYILSVDLSEGLGQDYSIINIFKIGIKDKEIIEKQRINYTSLINFFRLEQVGIFRSNIISIKQLSELLYMIVFEYLDPENVKIVLELNNYGNTLLAEMPHVFDGNNDYGSSIFLRYKHRIDSTEEKIGLKIGENKNMMVKDYQDLMLDKSFLINHQQTILEITTFVKHITPSGNVRYAADSGNDDCLLPDTMIKTINGYKKIKNIKLGELVLTHLGNYKPVTNIAIKDFDGDMYKVKFKGQLELDITYNHPIYIATENYSRKNLNNYNRYDKRIWTLPSDIKGKYRCVNIIKNEENSEKNMKFDENFSKFIGLFLADGDCYEFNNTTYKISIVFNIKQKDLISEITNYLNSLNIELSYVIKNNSYTIIFNNKNFYDLLIDCYDSETKEKILPPWYKNLHLSFMLKYWLKDDFNTRKVKKTTSLQLALSMRDIALSLGKHAIIGIKDQYWLTVYDQIPKSSSLKKITDFEYSSIINYSEKYTYKGITYNLEVEDDNSYIANGIVVHNCVMTLVNSSSAFKKTHLKEMMEEWMNNNLPKDMLSYINECMKKLDYIESVDYSQVLNIRKQIKNSRNYDQSYDPYGRPASRFGL